jgi:CrcB protein
MMKLAALFLGGGAGTLLRYAVSQWLGKPDLQGLPYGTLTVNLAGSLLIGWLAGCQATEPWNENIRLLLIAGFLGGFTTFSAYSLETVQLFRTQQTASALLYIALSNLGGLLLAAAGYFLAQKR